jgi:WD40 repeat protein/tRNA A-37 threonylcarbamoyl transferase component Bud32
MSAPTSDPRERLLRECCAELYRRVLNGEHCRAEVFLEAYPDLASDVESALDLIYHEYLARCERSEVPDADEYFTRFPQWREAIFHQLQVHSLIGDDSAVRVRSKQPTLRAAGAAGPWRTSPDNFEILNEIGRGKMGVVYRAWQKDIQRVVALKLILTESLSSKTELARFRREAMAIGRLVHPNIVQIYRFADWEECPYLVLEHVDGDPLAETWHGAPQSASVVAALVQTLAGAVQYAHDRDVVHRDLRPGNVLLTREGAPKIIDFGLAKLMGADEGVTLTGQVLGTPSYMAPEQATGCNADVGPAADVYALGGVLYEGLTGRPPFRGETVLETLKQVVNDAPVPPRQIAPNVPRDLDTICLKCLQKAPDRRYPSAAALAEDLRRYLSGEPIQGRQVLPLERVWRWCARKPLAANLVVALLVALTVGFSLVTWSWLGQLQALDDAERARQSAVAAHAKVNDEKRKVERLSVGVLLDQAVNQGDHGNIDYALLLLAQSLEQASNNHAADLARVARINLTAFRAQLLRRRAIVSLPDWAWTVVYSPDGACFATASKDKTVRLFETATGHAIGAALLHDTPVWSVAFSPDGQTLATGCADPEKEAASGTVHLWSRVTGQMLGGPLTQGRGVRSVAYNHDGSALLVLDVERAQLWDPVARKPLGAPLAHPGKVFSAEFSPDGKLVLTGGSDGSARLWRVPTGEAVGEPFRHRADVPEAPGRQTRIAALAFSPDGRNLVTASQVVDLTTKRYVGGAARLWRVATGEALTPVLAHPGPLKTVAFSPDGRRVLTGGFFANTPKSFRGVARLWDTATGAALSPPLEHDGPVWTVAFSRNGRVVLTGGEEGNARFWLTATGERLASCNAPGNARSIAVSPNGSSALVGHTYTPAQAQLWEVPPGSGEMLLPGHDKAIQALQFSSDGKFLASASDDGVIRLWHASTGLPCGAPLTQSGGPRPLLFSPNSKFLLTAAEPKSVQLWNIAADRRHGPALLHRAHVVAARFSPDSRSLLTVDSAGRVSRWNTETVEASGPVVELGTARSIMAFDGNTAVLASAQGTDVQLWDASSGQKCGTPLVHPQAVKSLVPSPNAKLLAVSTEDGVVYLWNVAQRRIHGKPLAHQVEVAGMVFSPDGKRLLTWSNDNNLRFWNVESANQVGMPIHHPVAIIDAQFSGDGGSIIVATGDGVCVWDMATGKRLGPTHRQREPLTQIAVHPSGTGYATARADRFVRVFDIPSAAVGEPRRLTQWVEALTGRTLSDAGAMIEIDPGTLMDRRRILRGGGQEPFGTAVR